MAAADIDTSINMCLLFYGIKTSIRPFAASLAGIHKRVHSVEQELQLSTEISFSTFEHVAKHKSFWSPSCDTSTYSTSLTSAPSRKGRRSWLPPLRFQVPDDKEHPALRPIAERPTIRHQTPLSLVSINDDPINHGRRPGSYIDNMFGMSRPTRPTSSTFRRSTSHSNHSRRLSTVSSHSEDSSDSPRCSPPSHPKNRWSGPDVPAMPTIPAKYHRPGNSFRNGNRPRKAKSRPLMPPADFWTHPSGEQPNVSDFLNRRSETVWPNIGHARAKTICAVPASNGSKLVHPPTPTPPANAVLRMNINKHNINAIEKRPYEDAQDCSEKSHSGNHESPCEDPKHRVRARGYTLVKA